MLPALKAGGADFFAVAIGKTRPLEIGVLTHFRSRIIFPAQKIAFAAHARSLFTYRTHLLHNGIMIKAQHAKVKSPQRSRDSFWAPVVPSGFTYDRFRFFHSNSYYVGRGA